MAHKKQKMKKTGVLLVLLATYAAALAILNFGHMNPFIVALMPCLALSISVILNRTT